MDTHARKTTHIVFYAHKKFGPIEIKAESNKTKIEILDESNSKRVKVEAQKYGSPRRYGLFGNSYIRLTYIKTLHSFHRVGGPNAYKQILDQWWKPLWSKTMQPNINQLKTLRVSALFPLCFPTVNSKNYSNEQKSKINFKPTSSHHKRLFPILVNTINTTGAINSACFSKLFQNKQDSNTDAKKTPNEENCNKKTILNMSQGIYKSQVTPPSLSDFKGKPKTRWLQTVQGLTCNTQNKLLREQSLLKSYIAQGFLKTTESASLVGAIKGMPNCLLKRVQGLTSNTHNKLPSVQPANKPRTPHGVVKAQVKPPSMYTFTGKPHSLLQTVQDVAPNSQNKLFSAQPSLKLNMPQGILKAQVKSPPMFTFNEKPDSVFTINGRPYNLLQTGQGVTANPQYKLRCAKALLQSNMPQSGLKAQVKRPSGFTFTGKPYSLLQTGQNVTANPQNELLNAQSSHKFPFVKIPRPSPLLYRKLKERQLYNKMRNCGANANMDTQTK